jgi:hypothetical protein
VIGQYFILEFIKMKITKLRSKEKLRLDKIHTFVAITQFAITAILVFVILQMITMFRYNNARPHSGPVSPATSLFLHEIY